MNKYIRLYGAVNAVSLEGNVLVFSVLRRQGSGSFPHRHVPAKSFKTISCFGRDRMVVICCTWVARINLYFIEIFIFFLSSSQYVRADNHSNGRRNFCLFQHFFYYYIYLDERIRVRFYYLRCIYFSFIWVSLLLLRFILTWYRFDTSTFQKISILRKTLEQSCFYFYEKYTFSVMKRLSASYLACI